MYGMNSYQDKNLKSQNQSMANTVAQKKKETPTTQSVASSAHSGNGTIQRMGFGDLLGHPNMMDGVMSHLSSEDLARLSMVNTATHAAVAPVVPQVLAQELFQPPRADGPSASSLETSPNVKHIHASASPLSVRKKIDFLAANRQIATRALKQEDAAAIASNQPITGKGGSTDIAAQVAGESTALISASEQPTNKFSGGSHGHVAIKRPEHYYQKRLLHGYYPKTVKAPELSQLEEGQHINRFKNHATVMTALNGSSTNDQRNAHEAHEVMFEGPLSLAHVINIDGGLPQTQHALSRQAIARHEQKAAAAAGSATSLRAYKSHEDARTKLSKNSSLGTQYHLKGDSTTIYDLSQNLQDVAKKKRK